MSHQHLEPSLPLTAVGSSVRRGSPETLRPTGELDIASAPLLARSLREALDDHPVVVLDLRDLRFMDVAGLHVVAEASEQAGREGRRLVVVRGPGEVDAVFGLTGVDAALEMVDVPPSPAPSLHATAHAERSAFAGAMDHELESRVYHRLHSHFHPRSLIR